MKSMLALLQGPPPSFTATNLSYALTNSTSGVQETLLQSAPNTYYLLIWIEGQDYDPNLGERVLPAQPVTLSLPSSVKSVTDYSYTPSWSLVPSTLTPQNGVPGTVSVNLNVTDSISFVKIGF